MRGSSIGGWINQVHGHPHVDGQHRPNHVYIGAHQHPRKWRHRWLDYDMQAFAHSICESFHEILLAYAHAYEVHPHSSPVSDELLMLLVNWLRFAVL